MAKPTTWPCRALGALTPLFLLAASGCERVHEDRGAIEEVQETIDTAVAIHPAIGGPTDQETIGIIAHVNNATIEMAQLARDRATNSEVRSLAAWLLTEHDQLNTRTRITADSLDLEAVSPTPPLVATTRQEVLGNVQQMPAGPEWDRMYVAGVRELHETGLDRLREARHTSRYLDVEDRVQEMLRLLEEGLARVLGVEQRL